MMYKQKQLFVLRFLQNTQRKASTIYEFWILHPVLRTETARL